ncbi:MAG: carboxypeptidase-like regulatory domain-containing protein, partial [Tannerellaceae bacterium]|nr:carboxypeptidase-like regulatory domain-containing protein [Tannerellaceae bacterium]
MKFSFLAALILAATMFASCEKDNGEPQIEEKPIEKPIEKPVEVVMQDVALTGTVSDTDGNPLGGVLVATGSLSATTGSDGKFTFEKAGTVDSRAVIRFTKSGYFALTRSGVKDDEMSIHAVLKQKGNTDVSM